MFLHATRCGVALAFAIGVGACSMPMSEVLQDLTPGGRTAPPPPKNNVAACPGTGMQLQKAAAAQTVTAQAATASTEPSFSVIKQRHDAAAVVRNIAFMLQNKDGGPHVLNPDLQKEAVVQELFRGIAKTVHHAHQNVIHLAAKYEGQRMATTAAVSMDHPMVQDWIAKRTQQLTDPATNAMVASLGEPRDLTVGDFVSFLKTTRQNLLDSSTSNKDPANKKNTAGSAEPAPGKSNVANSGDLPTFGQALVYYFRAYFDGAYVDRFGSPVAKPTTLQNISDNEISGTIQVLLELLMDYYVQTPLWTDGSSGKYNYYPGTGSDSSKHVPTVYAASLPAKSDGTGGIKLPLNVIALDPGTNAKACGITKQKAQAIQYIAQQLANSAGNLGGEIGGSFGGINVGLGVLGKFSVGDNKTFHAIITTALQSIVKRAAEQASYRVLDVVPDGEFTDIADWVQLFLNVQLSNPPPASS